MAYIPKIFADHSSEFASRRLLTAVSGQANTYDVSRAEGTVFVVGDKPDASNLNTEFGKIQDETDAINTSIVGLKGKILWTNPSPNANFAAQNVNLLEFTYDMYEVVFKFSTTADWYSNTGRIPLANTTYILDTVSTHPAPRRKITPTSSILFNIGANLDGTSGAERVIPLYIIGYETGMF